MGGDRREDPEVRARFERALAALTAELSADRNVVALVLFGSAAYDAVWEWSDIDLVIVVADGVTLSAAAAECSLTYEGIAVHAHVMSRSEFRRSMDGTTRGAVLHSMLVTSRLLFCRDASLAEVLDQAAIVEGRDRTAQLMRAGCRVTAPLAKAEKWLTVRTDVEYAALWLLYAVGSLAHVEVYLHGKVARREVLDQALDLNPDLFDAVYTSMIRNRPTRRSLRGALDTIDGYLVMHTDDLFGPIIEHLVEAGDVRSASELTHHFDRHWGITDVVSALEWLARKGVVEQAPVPMRLTRTSKVDVAELGFLLLGPAPSRL